MEFARGGGGNIGYNFRTSVHEKEKEKEGVSPSKKEGKSKVRLRVVRGQTKRETGANPKKSDLGWQEKKKGTALNKSLGISFKGWKKLPGWGSVTHLRSLREKAVPER